MTIKASTISIHPKTIECGLWAIERYLMQKYGCDAAARDMEPLKWYINTGRASVSFISRLLICKPFMIGRILHEGGSYDEMILRVKNYVANHTGYNFD